MVLQRAERVAEVQFICDNCGKLVRTSLVPTKEIQAQEGKEVICCQCRTAGK